MTRFMRRYWIAHVVVSLAALACGGNPSGNPGGADEPNPGATDAPSADNPNPQDPVRTIRFAALGDQGTGSEGQLEVAKALADKCEADGCDFILLLGDNFYPGGVESADDPQWVEKFEKPYKDVKAPFYSVLGNHDYGGFDGAGFEFEKGGYQVDYSTKHSNYILPAEYYDFKEGDAHFFAFGTNLVMWDHEGALEEQSRYFEKAIANTDRAWKIAFGHHPYVSNGSHGNAGNYDGLSFIPIANGSKIKDLVQGTLCDKVDLYISGHDHNRQVFEHASDCNTAFVVSGAGAKPKGFEGDQPNLFQADTLGFAYFSVTVDALEIEMVNAKGKMEFRTALTK